MFIKKLFVLIALLFVAGSIPAQTAETYWISFSTQNDDGRYLLKIDSVGSIVVPAFQVRGMHIGPFMGARGLGRATALSRLDQSRIIVWSYTGDGLLARATVSERGFSTEQIVITDRQTSNQNYLQIARSGGFYYATNHHIYIGGISSSFNPVLL